jgi:glucokinase
MNEIVLAVDLGGTNLRMAAVSRDGEVFSHARTSSRKTATPKEFLAAIGRLADECRASIDRDNLVIGMGVGVPANFSDDGVLTHVTNLPALTGMNLRDQLSSIFGLPVKLENDATAAAIGEGWLGVSRDVSNSILVTLGTGVGGGIIINNQPIRGIDGTAGKIGHICVEPDGHPCGCGSRGCIEQYASATAIVRMANETGLELSAARKVYAAAMHGDDKAARVFDKLGFYLGIMLAGLVNTLNPEMIVIGGGAASGWDAFIKPLTAELKYRAFTEPANRAKIVRSQLGDNAGILGAARSAFLA